MDEADSPSARRERGATPSTSQRAPQPAAQLMVFLDGLKSAAKAFKAADGRNHEVEEAAQALVCREPELRRLAGDPVNPKVLSDLVHRTPEQQLIEEIRSQRQQAIGMFEGAWRELLPRLDRMRSSKTGHLFAALNELDRQPLASSIDRRLALVDGILHAARKTPSKSGAQQRREKEQMEKVRVLIKSMHGEGKNCETICKRLDAAGHPRPITTGWADLSYAEALASTKHHDAVKTWISKAIHK